MVFKTLDSVTLRRGMVIAALLAGTALTGCHPDMWNQPRYKAFSKNEAYADGLSMRAPVDGTFAYDGQRREWLHPLYEKITGETTVPSKGDASFYTGKIDGAEMPTNYFQKITPELLQRGKERYEITCAACHGYTGEGGGIIVQRGFPPAATYHIDRLREANDGYYYDVITNGFGRMYSYAARVAPEDRWAIIAYIRALQHSQDVDISVQDSADRQMVLAGIEQQEKAAAEAEAAHGAHGGGHGDAHGTAEGGHGEAGAEAPVNASEHDANAH